MPSCSNLRRQACTAYRVLPKRPTTSLNGEPARTSHAALYRYSTNSC
jgi:hypothetical protein